MEIDRQEVGGVVVVTPTGHLDSKTSPELETLLVDLLSDGRQRYLLDFSAVETISSAALRVLLMFSRKLKPAGGHLALTSLNSHVRQVFDISGFTGSFRIAESRAAGLKELTPSEDPVGPIARRAAEALGVASPPPSPGPAADSGAAAETAAVALRLLGRADRRSPAPGDSDRSGTGRELGSAPGNPLDGVSGGAASSPDPATAPISDLWNRLRRRLGSR